METTITATVTKPCSVCRVAGRYECSTCHARYYCSQACQSSDWPTHFKNCVRTAPTFSVDRPPQRTPKIGELTLALEGKAALNRSYHKTAYQTRHMQLIYMRLLASQNIRINSSPESDMFVRIIYGQLSVRMAIPPRTGRTQKEWIRFVLSGNGNGDGSDGDSAIIPAGTRYVFDECDTNTGFVVLYAPNKRPLRDAEENIEQACTVCKKPAKYVCEVCHRTPYCSAKHRIKDRANHDPQCQAFRMDVGGPPKRLAPEDYMTVRSLMKLTRENTDYRHVILTMHHVQLVVMFLRTGDEIHAERHSDKDQFIHVVNGTISVLLGSPYNIDVMIGEGEGAQGNDTIIIPADVEHHVTGFIDCHLYTIYTSPEHPRGLRQPCNPDNPTMCQTNANWATGQ